MSTGVRIGETLAWFDIDVVKLGSTVANNEPIIIVTARQHTVGGKVFGREIVTVPEIVRHLRALITAIESTAAEISGPTKKSDH